MTYENSLSFARGLDRKDPLRAFRSKFHLPRSNGKTLLYFTGNSLGLQPRAVKKFVTEELEDWANLGVEGHLDARRPWVEYHKFTKNSLARLTGAKPLEVVTMNQLTVNLHLLMVSFYRPTRQRYKILTEHGAFSSDQYAFESQLTFHGIDPAEGLIELKPRPGESYLQTEDIVNAIREHGPSVALVIFGAVQYYTGQFFDVGKITKAGHEAGAVVGFDLAHAIGNVPLSLHRDQVDFAVWCSYKYLNSGPGAVAGAFVHERHSNTDLPRFSGWWGHNEKERFQMKKGFKAMPGIDGWQLSNFPILPGAAHLASLQLFDEAGVHNLRKKSVTLTGYLEFILNTLDPQGNIFRILTPSNPAERGCQLSVFMKRDGKKIFKKLTQQGVVADWREPDVIRLAPVPLYNTYEDVYRLGEILGRLIR